MAQERDIKYLNKTFSDFKEGLVELAKNYFPDTYNDFSPSSPGMMFIEMASYVGDVLSFYQDTQLQETFLQFAKDPSNLYSLAYSMGYRPRVTSVAEVELEVTQRVDAIQNTPNWNQALYIPEFSTVQSTAAGNTQFILTDSVDFSISSSYQLQPEPVTVDESGNISEFLLRRKVKAFSGEIIEIQQIFGASEKFSTITLEDSDIVGILDITDSEGNTWYEVPYLGQETVFDEEIRSNRNGVSKDLILRKVSRRFVTRFKSNNNLDIQFGAGIVSGSLDSTFLPNPKNVGLGTANGISLIDTFYDPSNFIFTRTYGLAPSNTTLTIRYIKGGGVEANAPANTITNQISVAPISLGGDDSKVSSLTFNNPKAASGGKDGDTVEELRQNSIRTLNAQGRAVTLNDIAVRALSLPVRFGTVSKAFATVNQTPLSLVEANTTTLAPNNISLYTISETFEGKLTTTSLPVKENLKKYLSEYSIITDSISIQDAFIVNLGIDFEITILPGYLGRDILLSVRNQLSNYFKISRWNINQPINISKIYSFVDRIKGVQSLRKITFNNKTGSSTINGTTYKYSNYEYDINGATKDGILYPSLDPCIFEVKYPEIDIKGRTVTL